MDRIALKDALDGLFAYDGGAVDSGIHDDELRARCRDEIQAHPHLISEFASELYGQQPYTEEDREEFIEWARLDL
jgi:hypothetical protein